MLARNGYRWSSYQWFLNHGAVAVFYIACRTRADDGGRWPAWIGGGVVAIGLAETLLAAGQFGFVPKMTRPPGTMVNPNLLAGFLICSMVAAFAFAEAFGEGTGWKRRFAFLVVPPLSAGILLTRSRGGILVLAAVLAAVAERRFGWRRTAAALAAAAAIALLVPNPLTDRFAGKGDPYAFDRVLIWKSALRMAAANPMGVGAGQFRFHWPRFRYPSEGTVARFGKSAWHPHSEPLSALAEFGVPGAILFAGLAAVAALSLLRARKGGDAAVRAATLILFASGLHSLLEFNYHVLGFLLLNAAALAFVSARLWSPIARIPIRTGAAVRGGGILLLAAMSAYAAATYAGAVFEERGNEAREAGRGNEALAAYRAAARVDPARSTGPDLEAAVLLSRFESRGEVPILGEAIDAEIEAAIRNPVDYRYPERLGVLYARAADASAGPFRSAMLEAAYRSYGRAVSMNPYNVSPRHRVAELLLARGNEAEAVAAIRALLEIEPRYAKGWILLGNVLERAGDLRGAFEARGRALSLREEWASKAQGPYEKEFFAFDPGETGERTDAGMPR